MNGLLWESFQSGGRWTLATAEWMGKGPRHLLTWLSLCILDSCSEVISKRINSLSLSLTRMQSSPPLQILMSFPVPSHPPPPFTYPRTLKSCPRFQSTPSRTQCFLLWRRTSHVLQLRTNHIWFKGWGIIRLEIMNEVWESRAAFLSDGTSRRKLKDRRRILVGLGYKPGLVTKAPQASYL